MAKKAKQTSCQSNAVKEFMTRILIEGERLRDAYELDRQAGGLNVTATVCNSGGGLVESNLENMYHHLYGNGNGPELREFLVKAKSECLDKADANFCMMLIPLLDEMFMVHQSCIETLRTQGIWLWEKHGNTFDKLNQLLEPYSEKLGQVAIEFPKNKGTIKKRSKKVVGATIESDIKIIGKLTQHHGYYNGSCTNFEPLGCTELASELGLAKSTVSKFFKKGFHTHADYIRSCTNGRISEALMLLNQELPPSKLLGNTADKIKGRTDPDLDL